MRYGSLGAFVYRIRPARFDNKQPGSETDGTADFLVGALRSSNDSGNRWAFHGSIRARISESTASYEKGAAYFRAINEDPSDYGLGILRDVVAVEAQGIIPSGNVLGRVWGYNSIARVDAGGDGYAVGHESAVYNSGTNQTEYGTNTTKIGYHAVAGSSVNATAAFVGASRDTAKWNNVFVAKTDSIASGGYVLLASPAGDRTGILASVSKVGAAVFSAVETASVTKSGVTVPMPYKPVIAPLLPSGPTQVFTNLVSTVQVRNVAWYAAAKVDLRGMTIAQFNVRVATAGTGNIALVFSLDTINWGTTKFADGSAATTGDAAPASPSNVYAVSLATIGSKSIDVPIPSEFRVADAIVTFATFGGNGTDDPAIGLMTVCAAS